MIYFDNAATTPLDEIAIDALKKYGVENFYNPSALYKEALENSRVLNAARENVLKILHGFALHCRAGCPHSTDGEPPLVHRQCARPASRRALSGSPI